MDTLFSFQLFLFFNFCNFLIHDLSSPPASEVVPPHLHRTWSTLVCKITKWKQNVVSLILWYKEKRILVHLNCFANMIIILSPLRSSWDAQESFSVVRSRKENVKSWPASCQRGFSVDDLFSQILRKSIDRKWMQTRKTTTPRCSWLKEEWFERKAVYQTTRAKTQE